MISMITQAEKLDAVDRLEDAADRYESAILEGSATVQHYVNLMALYFVCLDPGYAASHKIGLQFLDHAFQRLGELLQEIESRFGICHEAIFWHEYALFVIIGDCPNEVKWRKYIEECSTTVPIIYFGKELKSGEFDKQLERLQHEISSERTARARYINSILSQIK